nr:protein phosphatase 1 regulatory subunit 12B-like [Anolis sagrei ordinatus]
MSEPGHLGVKRAESARVRRAEQLKRWKGSLTELEPVTPARSWYCGGARVHFEDGAVFLAACSSRDTDEVKRLLARGARLNMANVDGLTALHQKKEKRKTRCSARTTRQAPSTPRLQSYLVSVLASC